MPNALQLDLSVELQLQMLGSSRNVANGRMDFVDQGRALGGQEFYIIKAGESAHAISLQELTAASELLVLSSQVISLIINGSATPLAGKIFLFSGAAITSLAASNGTAVDAQVQVILAGS